MTEQRRIIFLDIDGVMNSIYSQRGLYSDDLIETECGDLSKNAVKNLNTLIDETGADLVLSSTWRLFGDDVFGILNNAGIKGNFIDRTPKISSAHSLRGNEIYAWMKDNAAALGCEYYQYHDYVILDDDSDMLYWQRDNFINVDPYSGFTERDAFRAKQIFRIKR